MVEGVNSFILPLTLDELSRKRSDREDEAGRGSGH